MDSALAISMVTANASRPRDRISPPSSSSWAVFRAASATRAPASDNARAHARPMPRLAPVMKAVRFVMRGNFHHSKTCMAYSDLRDFINALEKKKELKRVPLEVDPYLEITEFADRSVKNDGPALLFEKPKGSSVPLLINAFASMRRMEIALGVKDVDEIAQRIAGFLELQKPEGLLDKLKMLPKLSEISASFPKTVNKGPCKEVIRKAGNFSLDEYPILHCWP